VSSKTFLKAFGKLKKKDFCGNLILSKQLKYGACKCHPISHLLERLFFKFTNPPEIEFIMGPL
jgi:hypothetical protein